MYMLPIFLLTSVDGPDKAPLKDEEPQESLPAPALASILRALATHQLESLHRKSEELDRQTELQEGEHFIQALCHWDS